VEPKNKNDYLNGVIFSIVGVCFMVVKIYYSLERGYIGGRVSTSVHSDTVGFWLWIIFFSGIAFSFLCYFLYNMFFYIKNKGDK